MRTSKHNNLYDKDFVAWAFLQAELLRKHNTGSIDFEHLAEEIEDLGKKHKRELKNRIIVLMKHLLKMEFQPELKSKSWTLTIREQRKEISKLIEENPSLKPTISESWKDCYEEAKEEAEIEIGMYEKKFPIDCPWSKEEVLETLFK